MSPLLLAALLVADAGVESERLPAACVGGNLDLDPIFASPRCYVSDDAHPLPDAAALGIEMSPKKLKVRSGHTGRVTITLRNLTIAPLTLDVQDDCAAGFETMLFAGNDARADYANTCASGGGYGRSCNGRRVRIRLAPRGVARIRVPVSATKTFIAEDCHPMSVAPIEAGTYKLVVNVPFYTRVPGSNDNETRQVKGQLTVVDR